MQDIPTVQCTEQSMQDIPTVHSVQSSQCRHSYSSVQSSQCKTFIQYTVYRAVNVRHSYSTQCTEQSM
jgi:hypothetical protein